MLDKLHHLQRIDQQYKVYIQYQMDQLVKHVQQINFLHYLVLVLVMFVVLVLK